MSFIQFESAKAKEKARQELREARAELLEQAKKRAEQQQKREIQKELSGESNWMLPSVSDKIDKLSKASTGKSKKSEKKKSKSKKSSKKRRKSCSDSDDSVCNSSADEKRHKRVKKSKKSRKHSESSSDEWVESVPVSANVDNAKETLPQKDKIKRHKKSKKRHTERDSSNDDCAKKVTELESALKRDDWMTASEGLMLKTFSKERKEPTKPNDKLQKIDSYDPTKNKNELNPYWKSNGTGLPGFQKPRADDDQDDGKTAPRQEQRGSSTRNWQKPRVDYDQDEIAPRQEQQSSSTRNWQKPSDAFNVQRSRSSTPESVAASSGEESPEPEPEYLNDEQINKLAAQAIKAELKGKTDLAAQLHKQLEHARKMRADMLASGKAAGAAKRSTAKRTSAQEREEHVLLTRTDASGNVRPLMQSGEMDANAYGQRKGEKRKKQKKMGTHDEDGQRVRYFADDDRYSLKEMFEREKLPETTADLEAQYARMVAKHKNPNDDLDDIFTDEVRQNISQANCEQRQLHRAIREHEKMASTLENCDRCFDSVKLDKQLLVSVGTKIYMSLPWHVGLQNGHCILSSMQHVSSCTQLDEDAWEELSNYRKALTRMFGDDVIFYEIANNLHRRPHLTVHCIPIPSSHGESAPFYFKKAIEESEAVWSVNKQLISLGKKSLRAAIPKGLPYVWVNFGMHSGFAHVIEDQDRFPAHFFQEIIGGMLQLEQRSWRKPRKEQNSILKIKNFAEKWKNFDCTEH